MTIETVVQLVVPFWFWNTPCKCMHSHWCHSLCFATIYDCVLQPSCVKLLGGVTCVAHLEYAPIRKEVWWFADPTYGILACSCGGKVAWAQAWCKSGLAQNIDDDILGQKISDTIISSTSVTFLILFTNDVQGDSDNSVFRDSCPGYYWFWFSVSWV